MRIFMTILTLSVGTLASAELQHLDMLESAPSSKELLTIVAINRSIGFYDGCVASGGSINRCTQLGKEYIKNLHPVKEVK